MYPTLGDLHIAPFNDAALYMEQLNKANFWHQENFHGVDLTILRTAAVKEYFRQPVVDAFDIRVCVAKSYKYTVDFQTALESDLHYIDIPLTFVMMHTAEVHGLAFWFDVGFLGSSQSVYLSTSPTQSLTHWYQVRCLFDAPLLAFVGQRLKGRVILRSNKRQSYDVDIELMVENKNRKATNSLDLKNPYFRYTGQNPQPPPGSHETSPTDQYWQSLETNQVVMNGMMNGNSAMPMVDINNFQQTGSHSASPTHTGNVGFLSSHSPSIVNIGSMHNSATTNRNNPTHVRANTSSSTLPPSSIGGGISPSLFTSNSSSSILNTNSFPISNNLMIGDYVTPGNLIMTGQNMTYKQQ